MNPYGKDVQEYVSFAVVFHLCCSITSSNNIGNIATPMSKILSVWLILTCTMQKNASGKIIIVYDEDERIASQAATTMCQRGFENLFMLSGGPSMLMLHKKPFKIKANCFWHQLTFRRTTPQNAYCPTTQPRNSCFVNMVCLDGWMDG